MDFLIYSRSTPTAAVAEDDPALDERHWAYMDGFAAVMTARGPSLGADGTWTGSLHVVDLPDAEAALDFVAREPYNRAGLFEEHLIWRFVNLLGATMWQFAGAADRARFLVLARPAAPSLHDLRPAPPADLSPDLRERLIVFGELRNLADDDRVGAALAVQAPSRGALDALLEQPGSGVTRSDGVEVHGWEFGGRR